jgi:hypothetical protein
VLLDSPYYFPNEFTYDDDHKRLAIVSQPNHRLIAQPGQHTSLIALQHMSHGDMPE